MKNRAIRMFLIGLLLMCGCTQTDPKSAAGENGQYRGKPEGPLDLPVTISAIIDFNHYSTMADMIQASDAVIYGEVTDYYFTQHMQQILNVETIRVIESLYGDLAREDEITVADLGGYIPLDVYCSEHPGYKEIRDRYGKLLGDYTPEERSTKYAGFIPEGFFSPETGEKTVLFVKKTEESDHYYIIGGALQGRYTEVNDGLLRTPTPQNDLSAESLVDAHPHISYEELKAEIAEALKSIPES